MTMKGAHDYDVRPAKSRSRSRSKPTVHAACTRTLGLAAIVAACVIHGAIASEEAPSGYELSTATAIPQQVSTRALWGLVVV